MTISYTPNLNLPYPSGAENVSNGPVDFQGIATALDAGPGGPTTILWTSGSLAGRPLPRGIPAGSVYRCTDVQCMFVSDGTNWHYVPMNGYDTPIGSTRRYAGASDPVDPDGVTRWLVCDGRAISRNTYSVLYVMIGSAYGVGNGSTTFNIPDGRGRVHVGAGSGPGLTTRSLGGVGGEEQHDLLASELTEHTHTIPSSTTGVTDNSATSGLTLSSSGTNINVSSSTVALGGNAPTTNSSIGEQFYHFFSGATGVPTAGGWAGNNLVHNHTVNLNDPGHTHGTTDPKHTHAITDPGHNHSGEVGSYGTDGSHNNMQPFVVVNHIIRVL